jgi:phosphoribosyl-ATP pyrophosphohydrolase
MKTFEGLFAELKTKIENEDPNSSTFKEYGKGVHFIGKKIIEEAGEVWIASEYEGSEKTAEEMAQLIYHIQVMMIAKKISIDDIYKYL